MNREEIGVKDVNGAEVALGDIVEFWTCLLHGIQAAQFKNSQTCGVLCRDVICRHDEESPIPAHTIKTYVAISPVSGGGMWAKKLEGACKVIGQFPDDAKLLVHTIPLAPQSGPDCDKLVEKLKQNPIILKGYQVQGHP